MPRLLVVHHAPTPAVRSLADAVAAGALKHVFDPVFLEAGGALSGDGSAGAAPVLEVLGEVGCEQESAAYEPGATLAALVAG